MVKLKLSDITAQFLKWLKENPNEEFDVVQLDHPFIYVMSPLEMDKLHVEWNVKDGKGPCEGDWSNPRNRCRIKNCQAKVKGKNPAKDLLGKSILLCCCNRGHEWVEDIMGKVLEVIKKEGK
jgi:hypothetical protein